MLRWVWNQCCGLKSKHHSHFVKNHVITALAWFYPWVLPRGVLVPSWRRSKPPCSQPRDATNREGLRSRGRKERTCTPRSRRRLKERNLQCQTSATLPSRGSFCHRGIYDTFSFSTLTEGFLKFSWAFRFHSGVTNRKIQGKSQRVAESPHAIRLYNRNV